MTLSKLVPRDYIPPVRWSENSVMTSELIVVKAGLNVARSVFALGQKNATIGFKLTKFLQEKHTTLCGTISDVTQVNVHLQKKTRK